MTKTKETMAIYRTSSLYEAGIIDYVFPRAEPFFERVKDNLVFCFPQSDELLQVLNSYRSGEMIVVAKDYAHSIKKMRGKLFECKSNGGVR